MRKTAAARMRAYELGIPNTPMPTCKVHELSEDALAVMNVVILASRESGDLPPELQAMPDDEFLKNCHELIDAGFCTIYQRQGSDGPEFAFGINQRRFIANAQGMN